MRKGEARARSSPGPRIVLREADDELLPILQEAQILLLKHPVAAQAALRALVAEGRQFAQTPAGQRWVAKLAASELVRRGRMLWQGSLLNMLEENSDTLLPSALLDAIISAVASEDLTTLLAQLVGHADHDVDTDAS